MSLLKFIKTKAVLFLPFPFLFRIRRLREKIRLIVNPPNKNARLPKSAIIDVASVCNLKCPLCPTGAVKLKLKKGYMTLSDFKKVLDKLEFIDLVTLSNWGEALLNPEIIDIIKYARSNGKIVSIHSNLSFNYSENFFNGLVASGLEKLTVSLDGVSQENYSKYRKIGNYDLVIKNIVKLVEAKKNLKKRNPRIIWKFLVNKYNESEIGKAKKLAKELKIGFLVDHIRLADIYPDSDLGKNNNALRNKWLATDDIYVHKMYKKEKQFPLYDTICTQLFESPVINVDGSVFPC